MSEAQTPATGASQEAMASSAAQVRRVYTCIVVSSCMEGMKGVFIRYALLSGAPFYRNLLSPSRRTVALFMYNTIRLPCGSKDEAA